jgi:hypothetical protein
MTITRTEVQKAIADCESGTGWGPLDNSLVAIPKGALAVLIEAAKCARYASISSFTPTAGADWVLLYEAPEPPPAITHDEELDETKAQLADAQGRVRELERALTDAASVLRRAI